VFRPPFFGQVTVRVLVREGALFPPNTPLPVKTCLPFPRNFPMLQQSAVAHPPCGSGFSSTRYFEGGSAVPPPPRLLVYAPIGSRTFFQGTTLLSEFSKFDGNKTLIEPLEDFPHHPPGWNVIFPRGEVSFSAPKMRLIFSPPPIYLRLLFFAFGLSGPFFRPICPSRQTWSSIAK